MRPRYYVLDENDEPRPAMLLEWGAFMADASRRRLARTACDGDVLVSTVFLGLDHSHREDDPPVLWETMVFGGLFDQQQRRYRSREEALRGHEEMVARVRAGRN